MTNHDRPSVPRERAVAHRRGTFEVKNPFDDARGRDRHPDRRRRRGGDGDRRRRRSRSRGSCRSPRARARSTTSPKRLAETIEENAAADRRRGRQAAEVGDGRGRPRGVDVPVGVRDDPPRRRRADAPGHRGRVRLADRADLRRFPIGPVLGITPFNFPLNLVAHKVAPALAVGAPIVVKPASATPIGALRLAEFFDETDLPKGMYQVLPVRSKVADAMARDDRFRKISFTGSAAIGWYLKGLDPEEEGDAGARRQRRRHRAQRRRPRHGRAADRVRRVLPGRAELHQRAARVGGRRGLRGVRRPADQAGRAAHHGRPDRPEHRRRTGRSTAARSTGSASGSRRPSAQGAEVLTGGKADGPVLPADAPVADHARR